MTPSNLPRASRLSILLGAILIAPAGCGEEPGVPPAASGGPAPANSSPSDPEDPVDDEVMQQMRAMGYIDVVEDMTGIDGLGLRALDRERAADGYRLFTNVHDCTAHLIDLEGRVIHSWHAEPCGKWSNSVLRADGSLLVIHLDPVEVETAEAMSAARALLQVGWDGEVDWRLPIEVHHDLEVRSDGRLAVLTYAFRNFDWAHPEVPVRDDDIVILGDDGAVLESASITEMLLASSDVFEFQRITPRPKDGQQEVDLLHANSIEFIAHPELAGESPLYDPDNVLVCVRNQDTVCIFDWSERRAIWAWGRGELNSPHDATLLANGNVLVFDNGMARRWSRIVEVDPRSGEIVWEYQAPQRKDFFSNTRGSAQRLGNGNTLVTESNKGRLFEVTPGGERVWEFVNPNVSEEGKPIVVVRTRRVATDRPPFARSDCARAGPGDSARGLSTWVARRWTSRCG